MRLNSCENQEYQPYQKAGWHGVVNSGYAALFDAMEDPDRVLLNPEKLAQDRRVSTIYVVSLEGKQVFVKYMTQLKPPKNFLRAIEERLKWLCRPSRAVRSCRMSERVLAAGVRSFQTVLAARRRRGLFHAEDLLVTETVFGEPFNLVLARGQVIENHKAHLQAMGRDIATLHNAGIFPGDLAPLNLFLYGDQDITFIDHDRTLYRPMGTFKRVRYRNLIPLLHRVKLYTRWREVKVILDAYLQTSTLDANKRAARYRILQLCRRRIKHYHLRQNPNRYIQRLQQSIQED